MKRLTRNHSIFAMDKQKQPVLYVNSGERFIVETEDCFCHQIVESDDVLNDNFDYSRVNPATGPIFVNGTNVNRGRHLFLLSLMQRRKKRQRDRLFVPLILTVLKYKDSKSPRGKLVK